MQLLSIIILDWAISEKNKLDNYHDNSRIGFFLEVDHDRAWLSMIILKTIYIKHNTEL